MYNTIKYISPISSLSLQYNNNVPCMSRGPGGSPHVHHAQLSSDSVDPNTVQV